MFAYLATRLIRLRFSVSGKTTVASRTCWAGVTLQAFKRRASAACFGIDLRGVLCAIIVVLLSVCFSLLTSLTERSIPRHIQYVKYFINQFQMIRKTG